jgi:hypothetical protein
MRSERRYLKNESSPESTARRASRRAPRHSPATTLEERRLRSALAPARSRCTPGYAPDCKAYAHERSSVIRISYDKPVAGDCKDCQDTDDGRSEDHLPSNSLSTRTHHRIIPLKVTAIVIEKPVSDAFSSGRP